MDPVCAMTTPFCHRASSKYSSPPSLSTSLNTIGKTIIPHPYQQDIIDKSVFEYSKNKKKRLLIELATGLGKTYTVGFVVKELLKKEKLRVLFLAHQVEILTQSVISFKNLVK